MNKPYEIYSDMDGVLADFGRMVYSLTGRLYHDDDVPKYVATKNFWLRIPPTRDFDIYWNYIKKYKPHILTAYPRWDVEGAKKGKAAWNRKYTKVPSEKFHVVARKNKQNYAYDAINNKPNVLIDDHLQNITEWKAAGGIGIFHTNALSTILQLKNLGFK